MRAEFSVIGACCLLLAVLVLPGLVQVSATNGLSNRAIEGSQDRESPPAGHPRPGEDRAVRVENERVEVAFESSKESGRNCTARVRISYRLKNLADQPHPAEQRLPIVAPRAENFTSILAPLLWTLPGRPGPKPGRRFVEPL